MSIYKGNKKVVALYKGATPIIRRYKGTQLIFDATSSDDNYDIVLELKQYSNGYGTFQLNGKTITPTSSTYKANLSDLGFSELTSFDFSNSNIINVKKMPDCGKVQTISNKFAYSPITELNTTDWNLSNIYDARYSFAYLQKATSIKINEDDWLNNKNNATSNLSGFYADCYNLLSATLPTTDVTTNTSYAFYQCNNLIGVIFNVMTSVSNAEHMFDSCYNLNTINGNFYPNKLKNANSMFKDCKNLDMSKYMSNISNLLRDGYCEDIAYMFDGCKNWGENDYDFKFPNNWNLSGVRNASNLFANTTIKSFSLYSDFWKMWNVENISGMFSGNEMVEEIDLSNCNLRSITDASAMFKGCSSLRSVNFYGVNGFTPSDVTDMFSGCYNLNYIGCSDCDTYNTLKKALENSDLENKENILYCDVTCTEGGSYTLYCGMDKTIPITRLQFDMNDINNNNEGYYWAALTHNINDGSECENCDWDSGQVKFCLQENMIDTPNGARQIRTLEMIDDKYTIDFDNIYYFKCAEQNALLDKVTYSSPNVISFKWYKDYDGQTVTLNFNNQRKSISSYECHDNNDSTVTYNNIYTNMGYSEEINTYESLFANMSEVREVISVPSNTSNVSNMSYMFRSCYEVTYISLRNLNVTSLRDTSYMFAYCNNLATLDLSGWHMDNPSDSMQVDSYYSMFSDCHSLRKVLMYGCDGKIIDFIRDRLQENGIDIEIKH